MPTTRLSLPLSLCLVVILGACGDTDGGGSNNGNNGNNGANNGNNGANNGNNGANNGNNGSNNGNNGANNGNNGACEDECDSGATRCAGDSVESCVETDGCLAWDAVACGEGQTCAESADGASCQVAGDCDRNGFNQAREHAAATDFGIQYAALSASGTPYDLILVQVYDAFDGPTEPGTYSLDGINYADCGLCVLAFSDCPGGGEACGKTFYAEKGSVEITQIGGAGGQFAAELSGVVFDEVTINDQFLSTPVPGGEDWCVGDLAFDQPILDPNADQCAQLGVNCVGETVPDFALQNCGSGEMVDMSTLAEGDKALWIVLTAGWCPACHQWVPQVIDVDDAEGANGLEVAYVLGEDRSYNQPTLEYCRQYARQYTMDVDRFFIDHDGQYPFSTVFANMWPYVDSNGAFGLPWNAVVDPRNMEYKYGQGGGGDLNATLEQLLNAD